MIAGEPPLFIRYVFDANVLIEAKDRYYAFDLCRGFWDWLHGQFVDGVIWSTMEVYFELTAGEDELADWVKQRKRFFKKLTAAGERVESDIHNWANGALQYDPHVRKEFAQSTDGRLVAHAKADGSTIVTHEASAPDSRRNIKIPDAARSQNVKCVTLFDVLRRQGAMFELG